MKYFRNIALLLVSVLTALVFISCGKDFQGDIDSLNEKHTNIEQRVNSLTTQVSEVNAQLGQLSVLSAAVEQNFYVTKVVTTTNGYELVLNDGHTIVLQNGSGNTLVPTPAVSMTMLGGFYYWTMNGLLLTDAEGNPIRSTEQTPEVRFDYTTMQWVVSIDGGRTFQDVNKYMSVVINDQVLMQIISNYISQQSTTFISQEMLYNIISTYIQQNFKELFNVDVLNVVISNYVSQHYTQIFSFEMLEKYFNQYDYKYITTNIKQEEVTNLLLSFIREHNDIFVNNDVLFDIVSNYVKLNKTTIFSNELLYEVINNFVETNETFKDMDLLSMVVNNYIEINKDVIFNTETVRKLLLAYVEKYYTLIFSQELLIQMVNTYVAQNYKTLFNKTLIEELVVNYVHNNYTYIFKQESIIEIINNYLKVNSSTVFNRETLVEIIRNYFEKNYNLFIDMTVISKTVNEYISKHETTLISVDVVRSIINNYLEKYYLEVFSYDLVSQLVYNYFDTNKNVIKEYVQDGESLVKSVIVDGDICVITLNDGKTIRLASFDAQSRLRDRIQSIVVIPNEKGLVGRTMDFLSLKYLVTPTSLLKVILAKYYQKELNIELVVTDKSGNVSTLPVLGVEGNSDSDGVLNIVAAEQTYGSVSTLALHLYETTNNGGIDIMTEFTPLENSSSANLTCPDSHHPHMIDLGLPSGTKWACCNVGATNPEDNGDFFAWGETTAKVVFKRITYQYYTGGTYINIGLDIAGTKYDAATVNWGNSWCMPSKTQFEELMKNTTSVWTTKNGVVGRQFTGANGGVIFIPAAGYRSNGAIIIGSGSYWTSMVNESYLSTAWQFNFSNQYMSVEGYHGFREYGQSVRAVSKD